MSTPQPFDPYAYAASQGAPANAAPAFDPYAYAAGAGLKEAPAWLVQSDQPIQSGTPISMLAGKANQWLGGELAKGAQAVGVSDPSSLQDIRNLPEAVEMVVPGMFGGKSSFDRAPVTPADSAADILQRNLPADQSISAAVAAPQISTSSPDLQAAIVNAARKNGGAINPHAAARQLQADRLPVPMSLSEGQALQDPVRISTEQNTRAKMPESAALYQEQNQKLIQNVQALRDEVGPEVFSSNPVEHGETLIQAYKDKDAAAQSDISAKYKALADANGGDLPMDGKGFASSAAASLKKQMKAPFLPGGVQSLVKGFADGEPMTFENFENLRTTLADAARTAKRSGDGNAAAAIRIVRDQLENMPIDSKVAGVKALADQARSAAKTRFDALRADPAYEAAVDGSVTPDRFTQKFVTGPSATKEGVATMRGNFAGNDTAQQTMSVAALDHLRRSAGIDDLGNGNFSQAGFNRALQGLGPRMPPLFEPRISQTLEDLGDVSRYTQFQPRGSFVNNSNTLTGALAGHAGDIAEHGTNAAFHGLPVGSVGRRILARGAARRELKRIWAPGAGIDVLETR